MIAPIEGSLSKLVCVLQLAEAISINDEQSQVISATKRKCDRLNQEMADMRLHLEEQLSRNVELEKKQRK